MKITFDKQREVFNTLGSKQFDSSEPFKAEFLNSGEPIDLSQYNIRFECKKPDGNIVIDDENITIKNICEIEMLLNEQVTVVNGKLNCQFVLVHKVNEKQNSTFTFYMDVQQSVLGINGYSHSIITIAERLAKDIINAGNLHNDLTNDIAVATPLQQSLRTDINEANTFRGQLNKDVATGVLIKDEIRENTIEATNVNAELIHSAELAQSSVDTIRGTGNDSKIILPSDWIGTEPNLTYTWNHGLKTKNISVDVFDEDTGETLFWSVSVNDIDNISIQSKTRRHLRVVSSAKYYSGGMDSKEKIDEVGVELVKVNASLEHNMNYVLNRPQSETVNLKRIGRKINFGENPNATNYNSNGIECMMQGGCKIDDNTIAYMLWDSLNINLNKNKLIILNINTGDIIKEKEFVFGWCNSIDYYDGKLYIAERGNNTGNNGKIRVLDYSTLNEINVLNLNINVNAISIHDNLIYALKEGSNDILKYTLNGEDTNDIITLNTDIDGLYNQNILITDEYIYLLSSGFSNLINIFDKEGLMVKSCNIPRYGGLYYVGEPQFIVELSNNNMLLGSVSAYFNEFISQFFKFNLVNNISMQLPINNYANTFVVDNDTNNFNPDGTIGNEFKTINECSNLNIRNIILDCKNKNYKYTYITDNEMYIRLLNAELIEGVFAQYGNLTFKNCNIHYSINVNDKSCLRARDTSVILDSCTFDGKNEEYCINTERNCSVKIITPKFKNYTKDVINNSGIGNIINFNNYENMPFVRHSNISKYSLFSNGFINNYLTGSYSYNTDLSQSEIQKLLDNCNRIKIIYQPFNNSTKVIELTKISSHQYTFVDTTVSTSSILIRHCKTTIKLTNSGYTIETNKTTTFDGTKWLQVENDSNTSSDLFNTIRSIELIP